MDTADVKVSLEIRGERLLVTLDVAIEEADVLENVLAPGAVDDIISAISAETGVDFG